MSQHSVVLSWTASTDTVDGYDVYRGTVAGTESATPLNTTLITGTTYTDSNPPVGNVFYVVKASKSGVLSIPSNEVEAVLLPSPATSLVVVSSS